MKTFVPDYHLKDRTDLVNENFESFVVNTQINGALYNEAKNLFSSYLLYDDIRQVFNEKKMGNLATDMRLSIDDLKKLGKNNIDLTINYIRDNISLNRFFPK